MELSERLQSASAAILNDWMSSVVSQVPPAKALAVEELRNAMPDFLDKLHELFSIKPSPKAADEFIQVCLMHGRQRADFENYSLEDVLVEYRLLRTTIFHHLEAKQPISTLERTILLEAVDQGLIQAATAFAERLGFTRAQHDQIVALKKTLQTSKSATKTAIDEREVSREDVRRLEVERSQRELFVSMLSHDLRTPLTAARLNAERLGFSGGLSPDDRRLATRVI